VTRPRQSGLTLIEVLVSLSLFSIIGTSGLALLQSLARTEARLADQTQSLEAADHTFTLLARTMANTDGFEVGDGKLTLQTGDTRQVFLFENDALLRRVTHQDHSMDQTLLAVQSARWSQTTGPNGTIIRLEITLGSGLAGERLFFLPRSPS